MIKDFNSKKFRLFCSKPFKWFEISELKEKGDVFMCCPTWLDTPIGNLLNQSVDEIWNGKKAQEIRKSILDGSYRYCNLSRCPYYQTVSGPVQRVEDIEDEDLKQVIEKTLTHLPYGPREINCAHDRSCNLSCPSCRTQLVVEIENKEKILEIQDKIASQALRDANYLYITGSGDPFGSPFFRSWLQNMNIQDMPNLKKINLHTNGLLWTKRMWNSIPNQIQNLIKSTEISIDAATPETYSINRRGGNFKKLLENLQFISDLRESGPLEWVGISMVVQENNFREMPKFIKLGTRFSFDSVYFSQLVNWGTYSEDEYLTRAIHLPNHPKYIEFKKFITSDIFNEPFVHLGNLTNIRNSANYLEVDKITSFYNKIGTTLLKYLGIN